MDDENKVIEQDSLNAAKAQAFIEADKQARAQACFTKIQDALKEFNCLLISVPFFTPDGRTDARSEVVPK